MIADIDVYLMFPDQSPPGRKVLDVRVRPFPSYGCLSESKVATANMPGKIWEGGEEVKEEGAMAARPKFGTRFLPPFSLLTALVPPT